MKKFDSIDSLVNDWLQGCYKATASNIAAITPPNNPKSKAQMRAYYIGADGETKVNLSKARLSKLVIKQYKDRLDETVKAGSLYLLSDSKNKYKVIIPSQVGLYVYDKGQGKRKPRTPNLPVFTDAESAYKWYAANSRYRYAKKSYQRIIDSGAKAIVTSPKIVDRVRNIIKAKVGSFIAGWQSFFNVVNMKIQPFTTATAIQRAGGKGSAESYNGNLWADNGANTSPALNRYVQGFLSESRIEKDLDYYKKQRMPYLLKALKKHFGKTNKESKGIIINFNL